MAHYVDLSKIETFAEFARRKEVSVSAVYLWEKAGKINTIEKGSMAFVLLDEKAEAVKNKRKRKDKK